VKHQIDVTVEIAGTRTRYSSELPVGDRGYEGRRGHRHHL
jgi:hypothetical protein